MNCILNLGLEITGNFFFSKLLIKKFFRQSVGIVASQVT